MIRAHLMLADAAQAIAGKLYILGGGWSVIVPGAPFAVAAKVEVPYDLATKHHEWSLELLDADGEPFMIQQGPNAEPTPLVSRDGFCTGIPAHVKPGIPLDHVIAVSVGPGLPLMPNSRYQWRFSIDGRDDEDWCLGFSTTEVPQQLLAA